MRTGSWLVALLAVLHFVVISTPCFALQPAAQPVAPAQVQPVPYNTGQPVQYGAQPTPAPPQIYTTPPPGTAGTPDTVVLKNGGMIRGTLVEVLPNDHATVQLPSGQSAIIQWAEIHHIERGGAPTAAPSVPPQGGLVPLPATTAPVTGPTVLVHIETQRRVTLDRRNPGDDQPWVTACESPCDVQLPLNNDYRIVGEGIWASGEFELDGNPGQRVVIKVNPATRFARTAGIVTAGIGLTAAIVGIYVVAVSATANCVNTANVTTGCETSGGGTTVGWVIVAAGLVTAAVGGVLILMNLRTGQSQDLQSPAARAAGLWRGDLAKATTTEEGADAFKRVPTFRATSATDRAMPIPTSIPLLSGSF
jgi:hypothetical protein